MSKLTGPTHNMEAPMLWITCFWAIYGLAVVSAQSIADQPKEPHNLQNQVSPGIDPKNPWATYHNPDYHYYQYTDVDRQGILNNPQNVAIGAVAAGGAIGLGGLALGIADNRQNLNRFSDRQNQICSDNRAIATQLDALVQAIVSTISVAGAVAASPVTASSRQFPNVQQIEQTFSTIRSRIPSVNC